MSLARCFLGWDCFGVHKTIIKILIAVERREMTDHERVSAVMLFVIIMQLLKFCGANHNFDPHFAFCFAAQRSSHLSTAF